MAAKMDKKLAKKLAKMSEEERAAFLEEQRRAEEEMKLKKEEMLSRFLKVSEHFSGDWIALLVHDWSLLLNWSMCISAGQIGERAKIGQNKSNEASEQMERRHETRCV